MSKRQFKAQASSSRASAGGFGGFGSTTGSSLSYLSEPANLTSISDANVVVAFKNLSKKDSTTKTKGLEDLRSYVQLHPFEENGGVEQPILEAWVKQYPRISIDNSRRVRELSHNLQYELLKSARKRMEKFIPVIVGAWLAGTYDRDRQVSRAASDGIRSFLDTEEKVLVFWRKCQPQILAYSQEAIEETPETLSDERTVNLDDMKAKYDRVIGSSLSLVVNLLAKLSTEDIQKHQEAYKSFLSGNKTLWKFASSNDAFVRRTTDQLLQVSLQKQESIIANDLELVSGAFVSEGLKSTQTSSATQLLQALNILTAKFPDVWTSSYKGKRAPLSRLRHFIGRGSQAGPAEFWELWTSLLRKLPSGVLPKDIEGTLDLLKAQREGLSSREESRTNLVAAWTSYVEVLRISIHGLPESEVPGEILTTSVYPIFHQYLRPSVENARWSIGNNPALLAKMFELCKATGAENSLKTEWQNLAGLLIENILTSLPEKSKDYSKSQMAVIAEANRWFSLQGHILKSSPNESNIHLLSEASEKVISKAIEALVTRNGKPFGAAGTLESALKLSTRVVTASSSTLELLTNFLEEHLPKLSISPSASYLISSLNVLHSLPEQQKTYSSIWQATMDGLLTSPLDDSKLRAITGLISYEAASSLAKDDEGLQDCFAKTLETAMEGSSLAYSLFEAAVTFGAMSKTTQELTINTLVELLGHDARSRNALDALDLIARKQPALLQDETLHVTLMTRLLAIKETSDQELISKATKLRAVLDGGSGALSNPITSLVQIIQENLENSNPQSLSIDTLVQQALGVLISDEDTNIADFFPTPHTWLLQSLRSLLSHPLNPAIALTNPLGGAVFLVQSQSSKLDTAPGRDLNGFSIAFRKALYTSKLITALENKCVIPLELHVDLLRLLCITVELANDQLGLQEANQLWSHVSNDEVENEIQDFLSTTQKLLVSTLNDAKDWRNSEASSTLAGRLISELLRGSRKATPESFYQARALSTLLSNAVELNGWQTVGGEEWLTSLDVLKNSTTDIFEAAAVLTGLKEALGSSKLVNNLCNRLVSDIAGVSSKADKTLGLLVLLNAVLSVYDIGDLPVAQNRLVFAVRQISSWMEDEGAMSASLASEACQCLQLLFPCVSGVYGSHWEIALKFCVKSMSPPMAGERLDARLFLYDSSLKLIKLCQKLVRNADEDDKNDDIEDALKQVGSDLPNGLIQLLKLPRTKENQPWRIVDERLCREVENIPVSALEEPEDIYPLVASDFKLVQTAAFDLMRRYALEKTESINFDTILEKQDATLPQELLSLLLDAPTYEFYPEEILIQFPAAVRTYLLSWHLVFDYFVNASYKVRSDYSDNLKSENCIVPLLEFLVEVLGHSIARAINLDKAQITPEHIRAYNYKEATAETSEYDMQWLLVHLYYNCLKYIPSQTKTWWIDCKSKQTRIAIEAWTEKYFSPLIIEDTLDEVSKWAEEQEAPADDEKELLVKVSKKSREVYAGYEVDDMQAQIVIRLPATYPLEGVKVESVHRVAVSEKKWQSWLMITQGVITFSNGSITDGLGIFRKNVMGALKGQTECAICYSIVSSDRKMPDKRCQTCKNLFHSSCLFKWFASSNQSTCPLCRNPFTYGDTGRRRGGANA